MKAWVCGCGAVADPNNRDGSWRFSGRLVEHVHDGIRWSAREVEVMPAELAREGWRPRLANVDRLLAAAMADSVGAADEGEVAQARAEVRAMLDGTTGGAEPWQKRLAVVEAKVQEARRESMVLSLPCSGSILDEVTAELRALIEL